MSLDITLYGKEIETECQACGQIRKTKEVLYDANITHNLGQMANKAGIYKYLWRPEEINITKAGELIEPLKLGLTDLKNRPEYFEQFNAKNGWGLYEHFVPFVERYLNACQANPDAEISIWK